jgi:hypothetical protein
MRRAKSTKLRQKSPALVRAKETPVNGLLGLPVPPIALPQCLGEALDRVSLAALMGGAKVEDISAIYAALLELERLKRDVRTKEITLEIVEKHIVPMADEQYKRRIALQLYNERHGYPVTDQDRERVEKLNLDLKRDFPKKSPRFEEIDKRLSFKRGRSRYILEGQRKAKTKT